MFTFFSFVYLHFYGLLPPLADSGSDWKGGASSEAYSSSDNMDTSDDEELPGGGGTTTTTSDDATDGSSAAAATGAAATGATKHTSNILPGHIKSPHGQLIVY